MHVHVLYVFMRVSALSAASPAPTHQGAGVVRWVLRLKLIRMLQNVFKVTFPTNIFKYFHMSPSKQDVIIGLLLSSKTKQCVTIVFVTT